MCAKDELTGHHFELHRSVGGTDEKCPAQWMRTGDHVPRPTVAAPAHIRVNPLGGTGLRVEKVYLSTAPYDQREAFLDRNQCPEIVQILVPCRERWQGTDLQGVAVDRFQDAAALRCKYFGARGIGSKVK